MPTKFLKQRYPKALENLGGSETIRYIRFNAGSVDDLTGDVNEATAYTATPIKLPALVDFSPSRAVRDKLGLEQDFEAVLSLAVVHTAKKNITEFQIGDAFELPEHTDRFYLYKAVLTRQAEDGHLEWLLAVSRKVGRR